MNGQRQERGSFGHGWNLDVFFVCHQIPAGRAHSVQCRHSHGTGEARAAGRGRTNDSKAQPERPRGMVDLFNEIVCVRGPRNPRPVVVYMEVGPRTSDVLVTDLGTVLALGGLFATYDLILVVFIVVTLITLPLLPFLTRLVVERVGHRISEPEIKFLLLVLLALGALADKAGSEAVLPAYLVGLVVAGVFHQDRVLMDRMRSIAFALLTPFFFLRAGLLISASALVSGAGVIVLLFAVKMISKLTGVWPTASIFGIARRGGARSRGCRNPAPTKRCTRRSSSMSTQGTPS
jgi:Sodium/hydrogen exchanger family